MGSCFGLAQARKIVYLLCIHTEMLNHCPIVLYNNESSTTLAADSSRPKIPHQISPSKARNICSHASHFELMHRRPFQPVISNPSISIFLKSQNQSVFAFSTAGYQSPPYVPFKTTLPLIFSSSSRTHVSSSLSNVSS